MKYSDFLRLPGAKQLSSAENLQKIQRGYISSFDHTKIFYTAEGTGKPLVFLHGLICSSFHWTYQIDYFKDFYQSIWLDYRGQSPSETPQMTDLLNIESIAKDVDLVLQELNISDCVLMGHSMGVNIATTVYHLQPKRIAGMVLANGTPTRPLENLMNTNFFEFVLPVLKKIFNKNPRLFRFIWKLQKKNSLLKNFISKSGFNEHLAAPEDILRYLKNALQTDPLVFLKLLSDYQQVDMSVQLKSIECPVLLISGEIDKITPPDRQALMHQLLPNSKLETIHHGSHCPQLDLPELVNTKIEKFLQEIAFHS